jgi:quercetin dioxygenase-like cupin family protein
MTDLQAPGKSQIIALEAGEGRLVPGPEGILLKATTLETAGSMGLFEATSAPGFGPPRHVHDGADEWFYILDGEVQFLVGDQTFERSTGGFVFIPRGTVHAPKILGDSPARLLCGFVPGGTSSRSRSSRPLARMV